MSKDKTTCKNVPIEGQTTETDVITQGNLLEFNTEFQTCTIGEQHLSNNLKISGDKIKFKNNYFKILPKKAHCNMFEIEKWEDWFTIPYYYINNKYDKGTNDKENKGTYTVPICYKPCEGGSVVKNNKNECESIETFMRGKYKGFIPYDPFAIIAIIGTYNKKDFHKSGEIGSYTYHINKKNILPDNIRNDIEIDDTKISNLIVEGNKSIETSVSEAYNKLVNYITTGIDSENLTHDGNTIIKETIIRDINKFYDLFDTRDEFYMNYLKKIKYIGNPEFGHYQGARYAYNIANDGLIGIRNINQHILFMFNYCCNLCFSSKYLFNSRLKNYGILEKGTDVNFDSTTKISTSTSNDHIIEKLDEIPYNKITSVEYESSNVNIDKEDIPAFSEYEYVFKYFRNLSILGPFILLIIVLLLLFYWVLDRLQSLGRIMKIINCFLLYGLNFIMNLMYYFAYFFMRIFGLVIVHPLNVIMLKLPNILGFVVGLFILLLIDPLSMLNIGINMRPLAFVLLDFIYITLVQLIKLFIKLIIIIFSYTIVSIPILIIIIYTLYKITYQDLTILTDPHINFSPYKSGIMLIRFQMMRNDYFNNVLSNHINLVKNL